MNLVNEIMPFNELNRMFVAFDYPIEKWKSSEDLQIAYVWSLAPSCETNCFYWEQLYQENCIDRSKPKTVAWIIQFEFTLNKNWKYSVFKETI